MRRSAYAYAATLALCALAPTLARADATDPTLPTRIVVGPPRGAAPMARLDGQRTGRASTTLPSRPRLLWRARIAAGADFWIAVAEDDALVVASSAGMLVQIDARGRTAWTHRTGSPPATGPVLLSDGRRAVVTQNGELIAFDARGRPALRKTLPVAEVRAAAAPLPLDDGGLAFATGESVFRIAHDGDLVSRTRVEGTVQSLLSRAGDVLVVTERGLVFSWRPPRPPLRLGTFGGRVEESAALVLPDRMLAVIDHRRLMEFRLLGGARRALVSDPVLSLLGPAVVAADGGTRVLSSDGMLLFHDARGQERLRVVLDPRAGTGESAGFVPPVVVDAHGRVAFARPGRDVGIVLPSGEIATASGASCPDPIALSPAGRERFAVACRSGLLLMIGQN